MPKQKKTKSKDFDGWFNKQFGGLPDGAEMMKLVEEIRELEFTLREKNREYHQLLDLQLKWTAAMYARQAAPDFEY